MNKIKFGWDYYNYSQEPEIKKVIQKDFSGFSPDGTYPNDSDTLPLFDSNYQPTNAWHTKQHIRDGKVLVTIDMSFEGFPMDGTDRLSNVDMANNVHIAEVIHKRAEEEKFPTENIVLLSANHKDPKNYRKWCEQNNIKKPINWILLDWCERAISSDYSHLEDTFEDHFNYKKNNLDNMKHYLCLMRRSYGT